MKVITERTLVRDVASRWANAYPKNSRYGKDPDKQAIARELLKLDPETATAADVAAIIGNDTWCGPSFCNECGKRVDVVVELGEEPDYESATAKLCRACLESALALISSHDEGAPA